MTKAATSTDDLRERIIARPNVILDDRDVMRALIEANDRSLGPNVVDLRGLAMERLEARLERLEHTHRSVIAAAYENVAGMTQIHRACLRVLDPVDFDGFLAALDTDVADILGVDRVRLLIEVRGPSEAARAAAPDDVTVLAEPGAIDAYLTRGRQVPVRTVTLRAAEPAADGPFDASDGIGSEACAKLDLGPGRLPALLVLGARDPEQFAPSQGTDLVAFFAAVVERAMRRWLA